MTPPDPPRTGTVSTDGPTPTGTISVEGPSPFAPGEAPSDLKTIGRFEVRRQVGEGAFGRVYEAFDPALKRVVALKVAKPERMDGEHRVERFQREARAVANLLHANIVAVFDSGQDGPHHYIASAFVPGQSLERVLARKRLSVGETSVLVGKLAEALAYAHKQGIVHRDVKPANVMLRDDGEPLLMDFGLAAQAQEVEKLTQAGQVLGTPAYMAPEQWTGKAEARSDQYSLGCLLYELLTGQTPYAGGDLGHLMFLHMQAPLPSVRRHSADALRDLETICHKTMQKEPEQRYPDCQALADDLRRFSEGQPVSVRPPGIAERLFKWAKRNPAVASLVASVVFLTFLGSSLVTWQWREAAGQRRTADEERGKAIEERQRADEERGKAVAALSQMKQEQRDRALAQLNALCTAAPQAAPAILDEIAERPELADELRKRHAEEPDRGRKLRLTLALLPNQPEVRAELLAFAMETKDPAEAVLVRDRLALHGGKELAAELWREVEAGSDKQFRSLAALAAFDKDNSKWSKAAPLALEGALGANSVHVGTWIEAFRPVRESLLGPLEDVFRGKRLSEHKHTAALVLADYARDRFETLVELLLDADDKQYALLKAGVFAQPDKARQRMLRELSPAKVVWPDAAMDAGWKQITAEQRGEIEKAGGMVAERFALCQALPMERVAELTEALRAAGYRPVRVRPWSDGARVALVWHRDGKPWKLQTGVEAEKIAETLAKEGEHGLLVADVAGHRGTQGERYCLLLRGGDKGERSVAYAGVSVIEHPAKLAALQKDGFIPATMHGLLGDDGILRYSGVWWKGQGSKPLPTGGPSIYARFNDDEGFFKAMASLEERLMDVDVGPAPAVDLAARLKNDLASAEKALQQKPGDLSGLFRRAKALLELGRDGEALKDLNELIEKAPAVAVAYPLRAILHARGGNAELARQDLESYAKKATTPDDVLAARAMVDLYLGGDGLKSLEAAADTAKVAELPLSAARVRAKASELALARRAAWAAGVASNPKLSPLLVMQPSEDGEQDAKKAVAWLKRALDIGLDVVADPRADGAFASLSKREDFTLVLKNAGLLRRYASVWRDEGGVETTALTGLSAEAHEKRSRELAEEGWRPVALTASAEGVVSVWHRPLQSVAERERLAKRHATAGTTLMQLDETEAVWSLWKHRADPTTRSYLVEQAASLGVKAELLVKRLDQEKDVSARRALIVALGDYTEKDLPLAVRGPLMEKLLAEYRDNPDAGIHGAIDWLLRHAKEGNKNRALDWGKGKELEDIDKDLAGKDPGKRDWYVNKQGQTYAIVRGPVEFAMGTPLGEPDRGPAEHLHLRKIGRSYAIGTKSVTVEQWKLFLKDRPDVQHNYAERYAPWDNCPIISVTMYEAMIYCNWLSDKEGIDQSEWCYPEKIEEGMKPLSNYLKKKGYRLPTEAEWEFAARAGSRASRGYGSPEELLARHSWFAKNSEDRTWPVGQKRPNDLGLFDMHGNVWTWVHNRYLYYPGGRGADFEDYAAIDERSSRVLRGASFYIRAPLVRTCDRLYIRPGYRYNTFGLRPCRTYH